MCFVWFVVKKIAPGGEAGGGGVEYEYEHEYDYEYDRRLRLVISHRSSVTGLRSIRNPQLSQCSKTGRYFTAKRYATTPRVTTKTVIQISIQDGK